MGKGGGDVPEAPDPVALANAQAKANRVNVYSPYGSAVYSGPNRSDLTISPTSWAQNIIGLQGQTGQLLSQYGLNAAGQLPMNPLNAEGLPDFVSGIDVSGLPSIAGMEGDVSKALYEQKIGLMQPQWDQQQERMSQDLANRGLPVGGEAYNSATGDFQRNRDEAMNRAASYATTAGANLGMASRNQLFGEGLGQAQLANATRTQGLAERAGLRQNQFNDVGFFMGMPQAQLPQPSNPGQIDVVGPAMQAYQGQLNAYNANQQANSGIWNGLLGAAGTAAGLIWG